MSRKAAPPVRTAPMELTAPSPARATAVAGPAPAPAKAAPTEDEIRRLAYRKWEEAGRPEDDGSDHWFAAEDELRR